MDINPTFKFRPLPPVVGTHTFAPSATGSPLGDLELLIGRWAGKGFNTIWRPNHTPGQDRFLELNLTNEILEFTEIPGPIPNRGFLQPDIEMFGLTYLQQIQDANNGAGLHIEPGIWASVPRTSNPLEDPTLVRMASIPHGTTVVAQGAVVPPVAGPPLMDRVDITPFQIGSPTRKIKFPETNLTTPSQFRSSPADIVGITQAMIDDPNSVLQAALTGRTITNTRVLKVSSDTAVPGGGTSNTAFLQGAVAGPNAVAALMNATFWIETLANPAGGADLQQLQYSQTVLLNFNGLSWPHVSVATLQKQ
ncbi:heme-binding protein [Rhizobium calliandrae]|uniref:Heme-binding protein n=1 Tax=Rhizobium calliandrae TaxID=1312182 RepID=A0ABT7K9B7_9HYPH|nr:heme-binding protein [Rhizobium calliandrae]MDL2405207.1 heme-binding protein [Rhizobium calliandrae]